MSHSHSPQSTLFQGRIPFLVRRLEPLQTESPNLLSPSVPQIRPRGQSGRLRGRVAAGAEGSEHCGRVGDGGGGGGGPGGGAAEAVGALDPRLVSAGLGFHGAGLYHIAGGNKQSV